MKKWARIIILIVLILVLLVVGFFARLMYIEDRQTEFLKNYNKYTKFIQATCGIIQCDMMVEERFGESLVDDELRAELKKPVKEILKWKKYDVYSTSILVQMLVLNDYFDMNYEKKLKKELMTRKSDEDGLFGYSGADVDGEDHDSRVSESIWHLHFMYESEGLSDIKDMLFEGLHTPVNEMLQEYRETQTIHPDLSTALYLYALYGMWDNLDTAAAEEYLAASYVYREPYVSIDSYLDFVEYPVAYDGYVAALDGLSALATEQYNSNCDWEAVSASVARDDAYTGMYLLTPLRCVPTLDNYDELLRILRESIEGASDIVLSEME